MLIGVGFGVVFIRDSKQVCLQIAAIFWRSLHQNSPNM